MINSSKLIRGYSVLIVYGFDMWDRDVYLERVRFVLLKRFY
jgi:hypothetical protein